MTPHIPFWQRRFYVHPIQRKYCFLSLIPLIVCAFLLILLIFIPVNLALRAAVSDHEQAATLEQIHAIAVRIWPAFLISMLVSSLLSFFVTNKFAGPLCRIEKVMRRVAEGDLPNSFRVRRRDDLQEFAALLDGAFGTITSALTAIREQEALVGKALAALRGNINVGLYDAREVLQDLEVIAQSHAEVENILANFRLEPRRKNDVHDPSPLV